MLSKIFPFSTPKFKSVSWRHSLTLKVYLSIVRDHFRSLSLNSKKCRKGEYKGDDRKKVIYKMQDNKIKL